MEVCANELTKLDELNVVLEVEINNMMNKVAAKGDALEDLEDRMEDLLLVAK